MFGSKRKDSAIRTLVAETLVLAKTHGYVEKIEHELEEELQRDERAPDNRYLAKWRHKGEMVLKNKYMLLTVALFCVTECALILGELILDLHKVKDVLEEQEQAAFNFVNGLNQRYPGHVITPDMDIDTVYSLLLKSNISWQAHNSSILLSPFPLKASNYAISSYGNTSITNTTPTNIFSGSNNNSNSSSSNFLSYLSNISQHHHHHRHHHQKRSTGNYFQTGYVVTNNKTGSSDSTVHSGYRGENAVAATLRQSSDDDGSGGSDGGGDSDGSDGGGGGGNDAATGDGGGEDKSSHRGHADNSLEKKIASALHTASITICSILVFETILKALCAGKAFFSRRLETFDLIIVLISFIVDLVCMHKMPHYKIQDFVFILAFLLPWRVIRVVNSLVVAVQDHEHFRLKLIYGRKKKIVNSLRETEIKLQLFRAQCNALKRLCYNEGVDESKIDQILMVEECVVSTVRLNKRYRDSFRKVNHSIRRANKAGKSKCKIKIDNSSVILLNDKSDFPRLSPRPSLLNLVDKVGARRKSMQPQTLASADRDLFLACKDSTRKGLFKARARSNSESGRGTLSSPDDCGAGGGILGGAMGQYIHQNSLGEGGSAYSGLNTPIVIDRKASLSSPMMASHVRHILNSLDAKINQMNGSGGRLGGGRNSVDADSIAEEASSTAERRRGSSLEDADDGCSTKSGGSSAGGGGTRRNSSGWHQRRVDSIEEAVETPTSAGKYAAARTEQSVAMGLRNKRRASLQPQRCVDEDDADILTARRTFTLPDSEYINPYSHNYNNNHNSNGNSYNNQNDVNNSSKTCVQGRGWGDYVSHTSSQETGRRGSGDGLSSTSHVVVMPQTDSHYFTPTTIHVDPPSTTSNYSLSSSTGSTGANNIRGISPIAEQSINGSSQSVAGSCEASTEPEKVAHGPTLSTLCKAPLASCDDDDDDDDEGCDLHEISDYSATQPSTKLEGLSMSENSLDEKTSLSSDTAKKTMRYDTDGKVCCVKDTAINIPEQSSPDGKISRPAGASLKPKTLRTSSDIENQNNLTVSEPGSRTGSIEETGESKTDLCLGNFSGSKTVVAGHIENSCERENLLTQYGQNSPLGQAYNNGSHDIGTVACSTNFPSVHANGTTTATDV